MIAGPATKGVFWRGLLVCAIDGNRRSATVAAGVGTVLPVFVDSTAGGVLRDVDGNSLIDLGSGFAVTSVGNAAPEVTARVREQVDAMAWVTRLRHNACEGNSGGHVTT
jgi:4-aminobutyrate aminotransferase-like enzyme